MKRKLGQKLYGETSMLCDYKKTVVMQSLVHFTSFFVSILA